MHPVFRRGLLFLNDIILVVGRGREHGSHRHMYNNTSDGYSPYRGLCSFSTLGYLADRWHDLLNPLTHTTLRILVISLPSLRLHVFR